MFTERRAYPRANLDYRVDIFFDTRIFGLYSELVNISAGGVRLLLEEKINVATPVYLQLSPAAYDTEPIRCKGEVVWFREKELPALRHVVFDTGIKFTEIGEGDREKIRSDVENFFALTSKEKGGIIIH